MDDEKKYLVKRKDMYNFAYSLSLECSKSSLSCMFGTDGKQVNIKEFADEFVNRLQFYNPKFREIDDEEWDMLPGSDDVEDKTDSQEGGEEAKEEKFADQLQQFRHRIENGDETESVLYDFLYLVEKRLL